MRQGRRGRVIARSHKPEEPNAGTRRHPSNALGGGGRGPRRVTWWELVPKAGFVPSWGGSLEQRTRVIKSSGSYERERKGTLSPLKT